MKRESREDPPVPSNSPTSGQRERTAGDLDDVAVLDGPVKEPLEPVKDNFFLVYFCFLLLGIAILFPYSTLLVAVDYFSTMFGPEIESDVGLTKVIYMISIFVCVSLVTYLETKELNFLARCWKIYFTDPLSKWLSIASLLRPNIVLPIFVFLILLLVMGISDYVLVSSPLQKGMEMPVEYRIAKIATLACAGLVAFAEGVMESGLYSHSAIFPKIYTQAVQVGTAISSLFALSIRAISKSALPSDFIGLRKSALTFFILCAVIMLFSLIIYILMWYTKFSRFFASQTRMFSESFSVQEEHELNRIHHHHEQRSTESTDAYSLSDLSSEHVSNVVVEIENKPKVESGDLSNQESETEAPHLLLSSSDYHTLGFFQVYKKIWHYSLLIAFNYGISSVVYPGITTLIPCTSWDIGTWFPIIMLGCFAIGDISGKISAAVLDLFLPTLLVAILSILRLLIIPAMIMCLYTKFVSNSYIPMFLSFLNGYTLASLGTLCTMRSPKLLITAEQSRAGAITTLSIVSGLTGGVIVGWVIQRLIPPPS